MLAELRGICVKRRYALNIVPSLEAYAALDNAARGDVDGAIEQLRRAADEAFDNGNITNAEGVTGVLVETLLGRGGDDDVSEAERAIQRLSAAQPAREGTQSALLIVRLRAWVARARGDESNYRELKERHRAMAASLGYDEKLQWTESMRI